MMNCILPQNGIIYINHSFFFNMYQETWAKLLWQYRTQAKSHWVCLHQAVMWRTGENKVMARQPSCLLLLFYCSIVLALNSVHTLIYTRIMVIILSDDYTLAQSIDVPLSVYFTNDTQWCTHVEADNIHNTSSHSRWQQTAGTAHSRWERHLPDAYDMCMWQLL